MFAEVLPRGVITHSDNVSCKSEHQVSIPINNSLSHASFHRELDFIGYFSLGVNQRKADLKECTGKGKGLWPLFWLEAHRNDPSFRGRYLKNIEPSKTMETAQWDISPLKGFCKKILAERKNL